MKRVPILLLALLVAGCSVNPVTGNRQLNFYSEEDEIEMGREADPVIVAQYGLMEDEAVQQYVSGIGQRMVPVSHRPELEFHFKVLDDPIVNAFALPGGYVYITRGILAYLDNEAALAGVVGHEIGHITAQHTVTRISTQTAMGLGLAVGSAVAQDIPFVSDIAGTSAQLLFLKFSRDDERQSDRLGVEYATALGYDTTHMAEFFHTLDRLSPESGGLPGWASTHPDPGERWVTVRELTAQEWQEVSGPFTEGRERYLDTIDGIIFGPDPREGFFRDDWFHHPELKFRFPVPEGWKGQNTRAAVGVFEPNQKAVLILGSASKEGARVAADAFVANEGVQNLGISPATMAGDPAWRVQSRVPTDGGVLRVVSTFFDRSGSTWVMHGYSAEPDFETFEPLFLQSMDGFANETDPEILATRPYRIDIVTNDRARSFSDFAAAYPIPSGAMIDSVEGLAILNGVKTTDQIPAGQKMKIVVHPGS